MDDERTLQVDKAEQPQAQPARRAEVSQQHVEAQNRALSTLYKVDAAINEYGGELTRTLSAALELVLASTDGRCGMIHLMDEGDQTLRLVAHQGLSKDAIGHVEVLHLEDALVTQAIGDVRTRSGSYHDSRLRITLANAGVEPLVAVPLRSSGKAFGLLTLIGGQGQQPLSEDTLTLLRAIADRLGGAIEIVRLREQAAVLEERARLARELHDSVTQALYSLTLLAETGQRFAQRGDLESTAPQVTRLGEVAAQALKDMRLLIYELRPLVLEQKGLVGALRRRLETVEERAGVETHLEVLEERPLSPRIEEELYRIALEALNNSLKHAAATSVTVRLHSRDTAVMLEIIDNGQGFDPDIPRDEIKTGLANMRRRAERIGGNLTIRSARGQGTCVTVQINKPPTRR